MPAAKLSPVGPEHHHAAAGHVLAAVVAHALDHGHGAGVADREALAGEPAEERPAGGGAVEHGVADDHVVLGRERRAGRRAHHDRAARQALAAVVVRVPVEHQLHPAREPGAEALAGRAGEAHLHAALRQAVLAVHARDLAREQTADGAVLVLDPALDADRPTLLDGGAAELKQVHVDRVVEDGGRAGARSAAARRVPRSRARRAGRSGRSPAPSSARPHHWSESSSVRPISSSILRTPSRAMIRRASSATMNR